MIHDKMLKHSSNNFPSTLRHSLGFLPTILLRAIIEEKILIKKDNYIENYQFPKIFSFNTSCLFIDISHFFDNVLNSEENEIKEKTKIDLDERISPEFYYFCINRYYEKLISIITNHGGDVIFQGSGVFAIWPPEKKCSENEGDSSMNISYSYSDLNLDEKNIIEEKNTNLCLRAVLCALEIQKNSIMEIKHGCSFKAKIGCSMGECKFIIFQGKYNKYDYIVLGEALSNSFNCATKGKNQKDIIIDNKIYEYINEYINFNEFYIDGIKYCSLIDMKNKENPIKNNKATMNLIKINFSLEEISKNSYEISRFNHDIIFYLLQRNIFDEKWLKEIKNVTMVYLRLKMNKKDLDNPDKLQEIYLLIQEICIKNGGNIHKLSTDNKGILIQLTFGILSTSSGNNELKGTLSCIELSTKLKKINVFPFIGISTGHLFCGLCGTVGNRREYSIIGGAFLNAFLAMEKAETMYGDKKSGNDNILLDEKTMMMIDNKIPCKFWKKYTSFLGYDLNLFIPLKISGLINVHKENKLFPLIGCHLVCSDNEEYRLDEDIIREDNIIYFEENILKDFAKTLNENNEKKSRIKIISVTGPIGSGKTMLLNKSLNTFFQMNPKLREVLCNLNNEDDYPFIFSSNLNFTIDNNILLENDFKEYRGLQLIIQNIFNILNSEEKYKDQIINLIINNNCGKYMDLFQKIFQINIINRNKEEYKNIKQKFSFEKESFPDINSFIYDLFYKYKQFIESIYGEKLSKYFLEIPLIIIIEDFNICDEYTKNFINYYLTKRENPFVIITLKSFQIFPCYNFLSKKEKDSFYEYEDETIIKKYKLTPYDNKEKISNFIISILSELRNVKINSISDDIIKFLLNKTFNGIPQFIKELILSLYDDKLISISKQNRELYANDKFKPMIEYNDFTEIKIPSIIEKKVGEIIDNYLDNLDIYILKLASVIGNIFDLTKLKQAILLDNSANSTMNVIKDNCNNFLYEKLCALEENYVIEILYDLDTIKKSVICKFSVPFLREILYQRTPSEYRNQIHYIIGRLFNVNNIVKSNDKVKYMDEMMELGILEKHLKYSKISIHENFLNGKLSTNQLCDDKYININNLKTLTIRKISAKIKSIKINDDKNNKIKSGYIFKKSDGKITWEERYFVLTTNRVLYYYKEEDYKERNETPLGFFYLQNLFDVKLMTDGYIGGRKNIISLVVNEWIKKGELMKPRVYYLSVKDREEAYEWVITFSILKIKAFYEYYCTGFGYVSFPLYNINKNESIKQKKIQFKFPAKVECEPVFKKRKNSKRYSIYSSYLSLGKIENKHNSSDFEKYIIKQFLIYVKFLVTYSISTFMSNIQIGLSQNSNKYEDSKLYTKKENIHFDIANPLFYEKIIEKEEHLSEKISQEIDEITNKYKYDLKTSGLYSSNGTNYTKAQIENFKRSYLNPAKIIYMKVENIKKIKEFENKKIVNNGKINFNLNDDFLSFKDLDEPVIDKEDYLKYLDYTDYDGKLKEQYKRMDSCSVRSKKIEEQIPKMRTKFSAKEKFDHLEYIEKKIESAPLEQKNLISNLFLSDKNNNLKLLNDKENKNSENSSDSEPRKRKTKKLELNNNIIINEEKKEDMNDIKEKKLEVKKDEINKNIENKTPKKNQNKKKNKSKSKNKSPRKIKKKSQTNSPKKKLEKKSPNKKLEKKNSNPKNQTELNIKIDKEIRQIQKNEKEIIIRPKFRNSESEKEKITKSNNSKDSSEIIKEKLNTTPEINTVSKDSKKIGGDLERESGQFHTSKTDFKDLVIKMKNINPINPKKVSLTQQNTIKNIEYIYNDEAIKEEEKQSKETVSLKSNSGRFVFTLNGDNEKNEKKTESREKRESEEKSEKSVTTKKEIPQEEIKVIEKNKKEEEKEIVTISSHKKEKENIINNSNVARSSLNSISSVDNIESTKLIIGKNFDSINKLLADMGSRRWRRKSNITSGHFRKNLLNDMVSFSSSFSNFFNNHVETRRNSNFNFKFSRSNSSLNLKNENDFNIQINNIKHSNKEKTENNNKNQEDSLDLINKLKNLRVSLENEKSISNILKNIKQSNKNKTTKKNNTSEKQPHSRNERENKKSSIRSRELNTISTKSTGSNFFYPNVYYINPDNNLHNKTHFSTFFSKLKKENKS